MPFRKQAESIDIEDASQLAMLAYQFRTRPAFVKLQRVVQRLKTDRAKAIAQVIVGEQGTAGEETVRQANYYTRWAEETAKTAVESSRRPSASNGRKREE